MCILQQWNTLSLFKCRRAHGGHGRALNKHWFCSCFLAFIHIPPIAMWPCGPHIQWTNELQLGTQTKPAWCWTGHCFNAEQKFWTLALTLAPSMPQLYFFLCPTEGSKPWKLRGLIPTKKYKSFYNTSSSCASVRKFLSWGYRQKPLPARTWTSPYRKQTNSSPCGTWRC